MSRRVLPPAPPARASTDPAAHFQALVGALTETADRRFRMAELADYLRSLPPDAFREAVHAQPRAPLDPDTLNHLAGAIELACERRGHAPPPWTAAVPTATAPSFGSELASVRLHLLTRAPVAMRRRNLFVDASFDERV
ncbi:MAG TPA: hypothetical protein VGD56_00510 [Gemmatirosa sp.]